MQNKEVEERKNVKERELRNALGCFATGVTVVTALSPEGTPVGLTVSSFNSLSLDPPLVLWSLGVASPLAQAFERATHFAVNVLTEDQLEISQRFTLRAVDKFEKLKTRAGAGGAPLIDGCAATLECRRHSQQRHGDHILFIGEVERVSATSARPLLYMHGHYASAGKRVV